jgi:hypothetical protein
MTERDEDPWTECIRQKLEHSARDLDAATLSRLNQARQRALLAARSAKPRPWLWRAAFATAGALTLAIAIRPPGVTPPVSPPVPTTQPEDFTMLAGDEQLDLYQELDFYAWLDAQSPSG